MFRPIRSILIILFVLAISVTTASAQTTSVTLAWAPNSEPDLAGYYIYYKTGTCGEPYDGTGALQGNSPIKIPLGQLSDPNLPEYTLNQLADQTVYYFVVSAYDNEDPENESDYSNWVSNANDHLGADFGPNGLWAYDESSWYKLTSWDPESGLTGWANELACDFGSNGLWSYNGTAWAKKPSWDPSKIIASGSNKLVVDFDSNGLWSYNGTSWTKLTSWNPENPNGMEGW